MYNIFLYCQENFCEKFIDPKKKSKRKVFGDKRNFQEGKEKSI